MHEYDFGFSLPKGYQVFLDDLGDQPGYDIGETGIYLYAKEDLTERNQTRFLYDRSRWGSGLFPQKEWGR